MWQNFQATSVLLCPSEQGHGTFDEHLDRPLLACWQFVPTTFCHGNIARQGAGFKCLFLVPAMAENESSRRPWPGNQVLRMAQSKAHSSLLVLYGGEEFTLPNAPPPPFNLTPFDPTPGTFSAFLQKFSSRNQHSSHHPLPQKPFLRFENPKLTYAAGGSIRSEVSLKP